MNNAILVQDFIDQIWNECVFEKLSHFLHSEFKDYSLPPTFSAGPEETQQWIINTGISFAHHTTIEEQVTEADKCIIKIRMKMKHIGTWRNIAPTGMELETIGYRSFTFRDGKILGHWALIDGQSVENQLKNAAHGCRLAE